MVCRVAALRRARTSDKEPRETVAKKIRVYELGRELGLTNKEALDLCIQLGIGVKSHSSSIEEQQADRVRRKAAQAGLRRPTHPDAPSADAASAAAPSPTPPASPAPAAPAPSPMSSTHGGSG